MNAIYVDLIGRLGNNLIQIMVAESIQKKVGKELTIILSRRIPNLKYNYLTEITYSNFTKIHEVKSHHKLDIEDCVSKLSDNSQPTLLIMKGYFQRLEYFNEYKNVFCKELLEEWNHPDPINYDNSLLINIRAGDILKKNNHSYFPLPLAWYEYLISSTGKQPVFFGELDNFYGEILKLHFSEAVFVTCNNPWVSFNIIKNSSHLALPISTFSWVASFLSEKIDHVYFPLAGLFRMSQACNPNGPNFIDARNTENISYFDFKNLTIDTSNKEGISQLLTLDNDCFKLLNTADVSGLINRLP